MGEIRPSGDVTIALVGEGGSTLELVIATWLDAKRGASGSERTHHAYHDTLAAARSALQLVGLDLDGDPHAIALALRSWASGRYRAGKRVAGSVAPATYNQRLAVVSSFYADAQKHGLVAANPCDLVERRTVAHYATVAALDPATARERLQAIDRSTPVGLRDYALLSVALTTGRRVSEIASWRWGDLAFVGDSITIHTRQGTGGKAFRDPLPQRTSAALMAWLHTQYGARMDDLPNDAPIWINLSPAAAGRDAALSRHGIDDLVMKRLGVHPRVLRHTFARQMEDQGAKVSDIQARLGHTSLATTGRYLAALNRADTSHAEALDHLFLAQPSRPACLTRD